MTEQELREKISNIVAEFHKTRTTEQTFIPGKTPIRYAGRVFDQPLHPLCWEKND